MINFLFGNEGHGKSTDIIQKIKEDAKNGIQSYLIVPEQQTVISERELATFLPPSAQLYCEATNFTRLANKVFRKYGGLKYNYINESGKNLVMYQAICECRDYLKEYKIQKKHEKSYVKLFLGAIGELKAYSVDYDKLKNVAESIDNNDKFKNKLNDILLIWSAFENIIRDKYSDSLDDILMLEKTLTEHNFFKNTNIYIDSFYSFTRSQLEVIRHIFSQAENVTVALDCPIDCERGAMQYAKITDARDKLFAICKKINKEYKSISFDTDYKHKSRGLLLCCENVWNFSYGTIDTEEGIELVKANDEFEECEYVASKIKSLILGGAKYSDIAIIMRKADTYKGIINYSLEKFGIPYFYSIKTDILSMPVVKMIFSALNSISAYRSEDIVSYIKCGYTDINENELNDFESYMYRWNIYGKKFKDESYWASNPDGYVEAPTIIQLETLSRINDVREKVYNKLSILENCFSKKCTVADASSAVFEFLNAHNVIEQLQKEIDGLKVRKDAYELSQVWNLLVSSLDTLVTICGDAQVSIEDYIYLLKYALDDNDIGTIPSGEDNVIIGDAPTIRAKNIEHVFILGVNEGVFPAEINDNGFFSDIDKITLETMGVNLSSSVDLVTDDELDIFRNPLSSKTDTRYDDELLAFKNALSLASKSACVSCLKTNIKGTAMQPSIAFTRLVDLLGKIKYEVKVKDKIKIKYKDKVKDASSLLPIDRIYTKENAIEYIGSYDVNLNKAIKECFELEDADKDGFFNDNLSIDDKTAAEVFGNHIYISKSSLESFASCKLKYYCNYVLKLKPSKRIAFEANNIGTLNHLVIEKFFRLKKEKKIDTSRLTNNDIEKIVEEIIDDYSMLVCGSKQVSNKLGHLFYKLKKNLVIYLRQLVNEDNQSKFKTEFIELSLTGDGRDAPRPLKFKIGESATASLSGTADRVDIWRDDGVTYVKIVDYKSGSEEISRKHLKDGFGLQLFIYLFTLCNMKDNEFKNKLLTEKTSEIKPAGIMYFPMNISKKSIDYDVDLESDTVDAIEHNTIVDRIELSGFFLDNNKVLKAQDEKLEGAYIPKKNEHKDWFLSPQDFDDIYKDLEATIDRIGTEILSGVASAEPNKAKGNPCEYCDYASICRRR